MLEINKTIRLDKIKGNEKKILSGRPNGEAERKTLKIDELDNTEFSYKIYVPDTVYSLNSSFFGGLFDESLKKLGEEKFREKYVFDCSEAIMKNVEDGIFAALHTSPFIGANNS